MSAQVVLAVDPGRGKCGLAVLRGPVILARHVVPVPGLAEAVRSLAEQWSIGTVLIGGSTGGSSVAAIVTEALPGIPLTPVPEHGTTLEARRLYFVDHPPRGWRRLVPLSLQVPPEPYDDYAAVALARRYLGGGEAGKAR